MLQATDPPLRFMMKNMGLRMLRVEPRMAGPVSLAGAVAVEWVVVIVLLMRMRGAVSLLLSWTRGVARRGCGMVVAVDNAEPRAWVVVISVAATRGDLACHMGW